MARVFISYVTEDRTRAARLAAALEALGHEVRFDQSLLFIGASWRQHLMDALLDSDVLVVLWSRDTLISQFVPAEVGAARARPEIAVLPVVIGKNVEIPYFLQDLWTKFVPATKLDFDGLAQELDASIEKFIEFRDRRRRDRPKLFVSHRHKDEEIVRALTDCIAHAFVIDRTDIRCTSVRPYRLPVGENTGDRLRDEITDAEAVLGILTRDTLQSSYVAFELGSAWGQRVWTAPLLARGADQGNIPDPIRGLSPLFLTDTGDCRQLLGDMEQFTSLQPSSDRDDAVLGDLVDRLAAAAQ